MFQRLTFEDRRLNEEEAARYSPSFEFEAGPRSRGRGLDSYLEDLRGTRERTLDALRPREDAWLEAAKTFFKQPSNKHYYWYHFIQDEARHTGQIILIRKHLMPGANPEFDPYAL